MKKRIFFAIKPHFRDRQWDTLLKLPEDFEAIIEKGIKPLGNVKVYKKGLSWKSKLKSSLAMHFPYLPLLNFYRIPSCANKADLIYLWGQLPIGSKKPYIIEFDNPYVSTYYNKLRVYKYKKLLSYFYDKAYKLTFMSETSKLHFLSIFGEKYKEKSFVLYPYVERKYNKNTLKKKKIILLFIGLNFQQKGGIELLQAFKDTKIRNLELYVISRVPKKVKEAFSKDSRINFLEPMPRKVLFEKIFPKADILVFPTLYESFGLVALEALSFGLGIIATNVYAIPEMVIDNFNGILLHHPFIAPQKIFHREVISIIDYHLNEFYRYYIKEEFFHYSLYLELKKALERIPEEYLKWKKNSVELFDEKFSPEKWQKNIKEIFI